MRGTRLIPYPAVGDDLHAGNIALNADDRTRVFDWADISVASPFLSLAKLLGTLEESLGLVAGDPAFDLIIRAYLAPFGSLVAGSDTATLVREARLLGSVTRAVTWDNIRGHFARDVRDASPDPVASSLRPCLRFVRE